MRKTYQELKEEAAEVEAHLTLLESLPQRYVVAGTEVNTGDLTNYLRRRKRALEKEISGSGGIRQGPDLIV